MNQRITIKVSGDPATGKTQLLEEVISYLRDRKVQNLIYDQDKHEVSFDAPFGKKLNQQK